MRNVLFFSRFAPKRFLSTLREKNAPADYGSTMAINAKKGHIQHGKFADSLKYLT